MPRAPLIRTDCLAYHVTARANNKEWFYIPIEAVWRITNGVVAESSDRYGVQIHAYVLMANHLHMIVSTPHGNLDDFMRFFLSGMTRKIQSRSGRINHVLGARYRRSILENAASLAYVYKYVYRNPVKARICEKVEDYPFSTIANHSAGSPIFEGFDSYWSCIPRDYSTRLRWLNTKVDPQAENLIGRALRRYTFKFTSDNTYQHHLRRLRQSYGIEEHFI